LALYAPLTTAAPTGDDTMKVHVFEWFTFSHWGMFRLGIGYMPDWFAMGAYDAVDDDLIEDVA
jgi:hypothetical protein